MSQYDANEIFDFLSQTPEKGLRQLMLDPKKFTEVHFNMLLKIIRTTKKDSFVDFYNKNEFPKIKFNPNEVALKEGFWQACSQTLAAKGIISPVVKAA
ncbi:MAG: hypothetical protein HUU56_12830 [Bdellovibrionaceae bacterium]|nr:hypothetical protein [Pseudobdellovibrionaceae bacterium]